MTATGAVGFVLAVGLVMALIVGILWIVSEVVLRNDWSGDQ